MNMNKRVTLTALFLIISLVFTMTSSFVIPVSAQKKQVTLTAIVAEPKDRWDVLFNAALQKLK
jgi:multiple sugar transport system substrate-binding protein